MSCVVIAQALAAGDQSLIQRNDLLVRRKDTGEPRQFADVLLRVERRNFIAG